MNEPLSFILKAPVADVSALGATSIVTVGTTGRVARALLSSTTFASCAGGFLADGASLKLPCSATLTRMTEGEPKNVCR